MLTRRSRSAPRRLLTGALVFGCSRGLSNARDSDSAPASTSDPALPTSPAIANSPSTRGDVNDQADGDCVRASSFANLHWVESADPLACVYDGDRLAASLACERRGRREGCGDYWRVGSRRLLSVHEVRFATEPPPQWVRDIEAAHPPCHHGDGQPFFERFVVWGIEPDMIPVLVNGHKLSCPWRHGQTVDANVPKSEAVWSSFGEPRDIMCWPDCAEWVWRVHESVILRPDSEGVHLVAYQARPDASTR